MFDRATTEACRRLIKLALEEDLGTAGDITSQATIPASLEGQAAFVARSRGVLAAISAVPLVFGGMEPPIQVDVLVQDGCPIRPGEALARIRGSMRSILMGERTALNILQHLSGIATLTRRYVDVVAGLRAQILDTRKTLPGWRLLEKYAVRCGGGHNHRIGLYDAILIKDNHLAALDTPVRFARIEEAIQRARKLHPQVPVEIEVDNLDQLHRALDCRPDIILLDNFTVDQIRAAVSSRDGECDTGETVLLEASGGVTLETVRAIAETGVDRISVGALTHSAPALDIGLDYAT